MFMQISVGKYVMVIEESRSPFLLHPTKKDKILTKGELRKGNISSVIALRCVIAQWLDH